MIHDVCSGEVRQLFGEDWPDETAVVCQFVRSVEVAILRREGRIMVSLGQSCFLPWTGGSFAASRADS